MKRFRTLIPYGTEDEKKRLEDYISEKTGKDVDLGPIGYGGKLTLQTMDADLTNISYTQITYARGFPGKHFGSVDEFIEWHRRISKMRYLEAYSQAEDPDDVIALFYDEAKNAISYVCFRMFDRQDIKKYLGESDGKAMAFENRYSRYWLLMSSVNGNMLMFEKTGNEDMPYRSIGTEMMALDFFRYLISMNKGE